MLNKKIFNLIRVSDIVIALVIIAIIIFAWQYKHLLKPSPSPKALSGWATLADNFAKFKVSYPDNIFKADPFQGKIFHQLANFHKTSLKDGSDLGLAQDIAIIFKRNISQCDSLNQTLKPLAAPFQIGQHKGLKYEMAAEGEGVIYYCLQNQNNEYVFVAERYFLNESWGNINKESDFISSIKQEEVFNQILSTLSFENLE